MGPHEPYWRMNTSFSPPPVRWDYHFQTEGLRFDSNDSLHLFGSSNSKESRSWVRSSYQYPASDGIMLDCSSASDTALIQTWTPPPRQGISTDDLETSTNRESISGPLVFTPTMEGTSIMRDGGGSTSSHSDGSDFEHPTKLRLSTQCSFRSRRSFRSKPIHPMSFPHQVLSRAASENACGELSEYENTRQRDAHRMSSSSSSMDLADISERLESYSVGQTNSSPTWGFRCGLCDRSLLQRSPWSSRRIVRSRDMPVTGVLSCRHVFHAECLEQTTLKTQKSDPPCPLCPKVADNQSEQPMLCILRNSLKASTGDAGPSRPWSCTQAGDCVQGAVNAPHRSSILLLGRNRTKKNLPLPLKDSNTSKEFPGKLRKIASHPLQLFGGRFVDQGPGSCSKPASGPQVSRDEGLL